MTGTDPGFRPLLAIYSHPDDETFSSAGVMAEAAARGVPVTVICLTRGEAGDSGIPGLDQPEVLGAVRERELREAMAAIGVRDVRFMAYRDSGMPGSPHAADPRALVNADPDVAADQLVVAIRDIGPGAVLTFGADGIYGHDDHLAAHRIVSEAVSRAGRLGYRPELGEPVPAPALYYAAAPRDELLSMFARRDKPGNGMPEERHALMGTPREEITHWLDVGMWRSQKLAAIVAHRTQTGDGGPISGMADQDLQRRLSRETFVRAAAGFAAAADVVAALADERPWSENT
ncbi:MAG: PIG-L deacetylase family protein [Chloroflexota bacterium]